MRTTPFGQSDLLSTRLIYGCMRIPGTWDVDKIDDTRRREAFAALDAAVGAGYNHFDHADIYAHGECETIFGGYLRANPGLRDRIIITTKCGIRWMGDPPSQDQTRAAPHRYDFSAEWIESSCEGSLRRLGIDTIDVYLLHRPDLLMDPHEIAAAFDRLHAAGKVRHFGVSNFTPSQTSLLQAALDRPLVCNQIEVHPLRLSPFEDGTLDDLYKRGITPTSWSPVAGGRLFQDGGGDAPDDQHHTALLGALDVEAADQGVSRAAILMAWLLKHPSGILPIVGSRNPGRIRDAVAGESIDLSREAWYRILLAARGKPLP